MKSTFILINLETNIHIFSTFVRYKKLINNMKKSILTLAIFSVCLLPTHAQLLWKVSGNGLKHPSYLFGTHHLIPISFLDSVPGLYIAFNSCEKVVGELVMSNIDATAKIQKAAIMPNHIKMNDLLSDEEYKLVDNELKAVLKIGLKEVSIMNPTLILSLYEMEIFKKLVGITDDVQSDSYFQLVATEKGKKVIGLETADQQISFLFGNGTLERQADILVETIQQKDSALREMYHLNKLYKTGKTEELVSLGLQRGKITDMTNEEFAKLVDNRNAAWITKLPALMDESSSFIAVGAMHLGGDNGLIKLLKKAGYKVTPYVASKP
jgi:uncharacterized protein YbaP (TraB family)